MLENMVCELPARVKQNTRRVVAKEEEDPPPPRCLETTDRLFRLEKANVGVVVAARASAKEKRRECQLE